VSLKTDKSFLHIFNIFSILTDSCFNLFKSISHNLSSFFIFIDLIRLTVLFNVTNFIFINLTVLSDIFNVTDFVFNSIIFFNSFLSLSQ